MTDPQTCNSDFGCSRIAFHYYSGGQPAPVTCELLLCPPLYHQRCVKSWPLRVGYVARHVLGHTMHIVVMRGDFCVVTQTPGGRLVGVLGSPVWCSGEMDLAADHWSRIRFNRKF